MTVFAQQFTAFMVNNRWGMWLIILLPIILTFGINFNATRSPGLCLFLLILTAIMQWSDKQFTELTVNELFAILKLRAQNMLALSLYKMVTNRFKTIFFVKVLNIGLGMNRGKLC